MPTRIEWTNESWNPVTGCTKVSAGCAHCYAERMAERLRGRFGYPADDPFRVTLHPDRLVQPLHWRTPKMIFVCSMGDLFHERVPLDLLAEVFAVMSRCYWHTFQVLTKRPERLALLDCEEFNELFRDFCGIWDCETEEVLGNRGDFSCLERMSNDFRAMVTDELPAPNIWLGTTAENQQTLNERVPQLLACPAAVRFLSLEPLLGPVDLWPIFDCGGKCGPCRHHRPDWVIVGCENGPKRRACYPEWVESIVEQCKVAGVPVFVKQLSINGRVSHDPAEWPENLRVRQWPESEG